jgi:hypothetical protein
VWDGDPVTARERVRVAHKLGEFPATDDALRRGELSYSKVRAILRVTTPANEAMLLECARLSTASQLEKLSRKYARVQAHGKDARPQDDEPRRYVRRRDTVDGMVKIEAVLHPEEAELVWAMLDHAAKQLVREPHPPLPRGDSAEARNVADLTSSAAARPGTVCPTDDSSDASDVAGTATGPAVARAACPTGDSAEARGAACAATGPATVYTACPTGDSAEACDVASTATAWATAYIARPSGDSVEACDVAGTATDPAAAYTACPTGDSAEACEVTGTTTGPATAYTECPTGDSAESPGSGAYPGAWPAGEVSTSLPEPAPARPPSGLRQAADATERAFNRADALLAVVQAYLRGDRPNRAPVDVMLTIPVSDLREGAADPADVGCMGASCISAETARRLSCDAGVIEVVEDAHGVPLSVGRKRRTIAGSIKRALLKRDTACTYPGCTNRIFLEGHHVRHWVDGGETSLQNTALLCSHHHRYVHEYDYRIELGPDGRPQFRDPRGRLVTAVPARPAAPDLGWPTIREANEALRIDADSIACEWDGTPMRYSTVVDQLVTIDGLT